MAGTVLERVAIIVARTTERFPSKEAFMTPVRVLAAVFTIGLVASMTGTGTAQPAEPRSTSVPFTLTIDKQDGRRFSGTFSSARSTETVIGVISRAGTIYMVDDDGYDSGTLLAPNRMELCYLHLSAATRIASCTELIKQP
jgi:hypothetical protein